MRKQKLTRTMTAKARIEQLMRKHKTLQGISDATEITVSTLWRLMNTGAEPGNLVLEKLGLMPGARYRVID